MRAGFSKYFVNSVSCHGPNDSFDGKFDIFGALTGGGKLNDFGNIGGAHSVEFLNNAIDMSDANYADYDGRIGETAVGTILQRSL